MRERRNPPPYWAVELLERLWPRLNACVRPEWLPVRFNESTFANELGCGVFGCVLSTADSSVVMKLTADEDEVKLAALLEASAPVVSTEGIVRYYKVAGTGATRRLPVYDRKAAELARRRGDSSPSPVGYGEYPVTFLWREAAIHVGIRSMKTAPPEPEPPAATPPTHGLASFLLRKRWKEEVASWGQLAPKTFEEWLAQETAWHAEQQARYERELERWRRTRWFNGMEIEQAHRFWSARVSPYYYGAKELRAALKGGRQYDVDLALGRIGEAVAGLENTSITRGIGATLRDLLSLGIVLSDLHEGNFGIVVRDGFERWVVTDPSQPIWLDGAPDVLVPALCA